MASNVVDFPVHISVVSVENKARQKFVVVYNRLSGFRRIQRYATAKAKLAVIREALKDMRMKK